MTLRGWAAVLLGGLAAAAGAEAGLRLRLDFAQAAEGTTVPDASGNGHEARLEGRDGVLPAVVATPYGKALRLEAGKGQGLRVGRAPDLVCADGLTVMAWVRPERADGHLAVLANKGDRVAGTPARGYRLSVFWRRVLAEVGFGDDEEGARVCSPEWSIEPQRWAHLAMTFDTTTLVVYVNAAEAARLRLPEPHRLAPGPSAGGMTIGKYYWNDAYPFAGLLADVRVYDRALSPEEILTAAAAFVEGR